jgi:hypothetical protein
VTTSSDEEDAAELLWPLLRAAIPSKAVIVFFMFAVPRCIT